MFEPTSPPAVFANLGAASLRPGSACMVSCKSATRLQGWVSLRGHGWPAQQQTRSPIFNKVRNGHFPIIHKSPPLQDKAAQTPRHGAMPPIFLCLAPPRRVILPLARWRTQRQRCCVWHCVVGLVVPGLPQHGVYFAGQSRCRCAAFRRACTIGCGSTVGLAPCCATGHIGGSAAV